MLSTSRVEIDGRSASRPACPRVARPARGAWPPRVRSWRARRSEPPRGSLVRIEAITLASAVISSEELRRSPLRSARRTSEANAGSPASMRPSWFASSAASATKPVPCGGPVGEDRAAAEQFGAAGDRGVVIEIDGAPRGLRGRPVGSDGIAGLPHRSDDRPPIDPRRGMPNIVGRSKCCAIYARGTQPRSACFRSRRPHVSHRDGDRLEPANDHVLAAHRAPMSRASSDVVLGHGCAKGARTMTSVSSARGLQNHGVLKEVT